MTGQEIKSMIKAENIKLWQVADALDMRDSDFSRRLRKPFCEKEVEEIKRIINELSKQNETANN